VVANTAEGLGVGDVFDLLPGFLVHEEEVHVIQEGVVHVLAHDVVTTTGNQDALVYGQVDHCVANSAARRRALLLYFLPLNVHDFALNHDGFDVSQLVFPELTRSGFASKKVYTVDNSVSDPSVFLFAFLFLTHYSTRCMLHNRLNKLLEVYPCPVIILKIKIKHLICYLPILILSSKNNHRAAKDAAAVIFAGLHTDSFRLDDTHGF
jgi:hypothetical protein